MSQELGNSFQNLQRIRKLVPPIYSNECASVPLNMLFISQHSVFTTKSVGCGVHLVKWELSCHFPDNRSDYCDVVTLRACVRVRGWRARPSPANGHFIQGNEFNEAADPEVPNHMRRDSHIIEHILATCISAARKSRTFIAFCHFRQT